MCYFAYSAVNPEANPADLERLAGKFPYHFRPGTRHDIKMAVAEESGAYRLTDWYCDCDFPLCEGNAQVPELLELATQLEKLRTVRGIKCVYLCKTWAGDRNKNEETVHMDDVDLPDFFCRYEDGNTVQDRPVPPILNMTDPEAHLCLRFLHR